jgi:SPOR domain
MAKFKLFILTSAYIIVFALLGTVAVPISFAASYVVHISSYQDEADAVIDMNVLEKKGLPAFVKKVDLGEKGTWFRVLVGPYPDYDQASNAEKSIIREKFITYAKVMAFCGFKFISKKGDAYSAQCVGGNYDGSVFKVKKYLNGFKVVPEISPINRKPTGISREEVAEKACGCQ